jgi:DegV family protein with EDD domain
MLNEEATVQKVAIATDTIACLTKEQIEHHEIGIVPLKIDFDGHAYREYLDISPSEAYQFLEKDPERFVTSAASPSEFLEAFRKLSRRAQNILFITVSSELSAQYSAAQLAVEQAKQELPGTTISLLDSRNCAAAEGFIVLAAARAAVQGKNLPEVIKAAEEVKGKIRFVMVLETIRYVYRSGRVPKVAAQAGSALNVKPILTSSDGVIRFAGVARTKQRGVNRLLQMMRDEVGKQAVHVAIVHADALQEAERLKDRVASEFKCVELWLSEFSPIMGYATGRGLLGLAFHSES